MTTKQQKAVTAEDISIDLNRVWTPSELITKAYTDANALDMWLDKDLKSEYVNEKRIFTAAANSEPPAPIKHNIFQLYRKVVGSREYLLLHELLSTTDYFKNSLTWTRYLGMVSVPKIVRTRSINVASIKTGSDRVRPSEGPAEIEGHENVYLWPFEQVKKQLLQWRAAGVIPDTAKYIAWTQNPPMKYSVINFENFLELPMEDLVLINKMGSKLEGLYKPGDPEMLKVLKTMMKDAVREGLTK